MKIIPRKLLKLNLLLAILVFCLPVLLYIYLLFPRTTILDLWFFSYEIQHFKNAEYLIYFLFGKFYVIVILSIWFLTISNWWRCLILPTIIYFVFQLNQIIVQELEVEQNINFVGCGLGVCYSILLHLVYRRSKIFKVTFIQLLTYDILKLLKTNFKEKRIFDIKSRLFTDKAAKTTSIYEKNSLIEEVRKLEMHLLYNNKLPLFKHGNKSNGKAGYFIAVLLVLAPCMLYIYNFIPDDLDGILRLGTFHYNTGFTHVKLFGYYFYTKLFYIVLLATWFYTTNNIMKWGIFINLIVVVFQMFTILDNSNTKLDEHELLTSLPIMIPVILTFILLNQIIKYKSKNDVLNEDIEEEVQEVLTQLTVLGNNEHGLIKELLLLRNDKNTLDKEDYFSQLKALESKLQNSLVN